MSYARTAIYAGVPLALLCGSGSLGTVSFAQDDGIDGIFDRARDRDNDSDVFERDRPFFEQDSGLPYGATLLRAADTECSGALVASGFGRNGDEVHGVRQGEERVFRVNDEGVPWACLDNGSAQADVMECPSGTTDVRIARDGNVARFECYGSER